MKLAIIIPYRDRDEHLKIFISETKEILKMYDYKIIVVHQNDEKPFNRAKLMNIGFDYMKDESDYFCFHDVDLVPIEIDYSYPDKPYHLVTDVPQFTHFLYGGVNLFNKEDFIKINGFSNEFWGWGGEDDDLLKRVFSLGFNVNRRVCKHKSLYHKPNGPEHKDYSKNLERCRGVYDYQTEGLNTLEYVLKTIDNIDDNVVMINVTL